MTKPTQAKESPMKIFVLGDSWVLLGTPVAQTDTTITLEDTYVIRNWGTTEGLGQLAFYGIRKDTILDKQPKTTIPVKSIGFIIDCGEMWSADYVTAQLVSKAIK